MCRIGEVNERNVMSEEQGAHGKENVSRGQQDGDTEAEVQCIHFLQ